MILPDYHQKYSADIRHTETWSSYYVGREDHSKGSRGVFYDLLGARA